MAGHIAVKVGTFPGEIREYIIDNGNATPRAALAAAGLSTTGKTIKVNGNAATLDTPALREGDRVLLFEGLKGGVDPAEGEGGGEESPLPLVVKGLKDSGVIKLGNGCWISGIVEAANKVMPLPSQKWRDGVEYRGWAPGDCGTPKVWGIVNTYLYDSSYQVVWITGQVRKVGGKVLSGVGKIYKTTATEEQIKKTYDKCLLVRGEEGHLLAIVWKKLVYVLIMPPELDKQWVFEGVMRGVREEMEKAGLYVEEAVDEEEERKKEYAETLKRLNAIKETRMKEAVARVNNVGTARTDLLNRLRKLAMDEREANLALLVAGESVVEEQLSRWVDEIAQLKRVIEVRVVGTELMALTDVITVKHERLGHRRIGQFVVCVELTNGGLYCWGLEGTKQVTSRGRLIAPHVFVDSNFLSHGNEVRGKFCFGNRDMVVVDAALGMNVPMLVSLGIEALEGYNDVDAKDALLAWPLVPGAVMPKEEIPVVEDATFEDEREMTIEEVEV